jgi:hypothetical protein
MDSNQVKLLTDEQLWRWFNDRHNKLSEKRWAGEDITEELIALRLEEKIEWKRRKTGKGV